MSEIGIGTIIRFLKTLECEPTGNHPGFLYAEAGEEGVITQVGGCREGFMAKTSRNPSFGVSLYEFEVKEKTDEQ